MKTLSKTNLCYKEKSVFDALKWLILENSLFLSLLKKNITCPLLLGKFSLACSLKKNPYSVFSLPKNSSFKKIYFFLPCVFSPKIMIKKKKPPLARCSVLLFYMTTHFFIYGISCFLFLNGYRKCMLETSLICIRVLFGK